MRNRTRRLLSILGAAMAIVAFSAVSAFAAADPTTGIDYTTDLGTPVLAAIKPAILAGLGVLVVFAAVSGGRKMWSKVTKTG
jgi:uncharacterized protein (UPF0261 family)